MFREFPNSRDSNGPFSRRCGPSGARTAGVGGQSRHAWLRLAPLAGRAWLLCHSHRHRRVARPEVEGRRTVGGAAARRSSRRPNGRRRRGVSRRAVAELAELVVPPAGDAAVGSERTRVRVPGEHCDRVGDRRSDRPRLPNRRPVAEPSVASVPPTHDRTGGSKRAGVLKPGRHLNGVGQSHDLHGSAAILDVADPELTVRVRAPAPHGTIGTQRARVERLSADGQTRDARQTRNIHGQGGQVGPAVAEVTEVVGAPTTDGTRAQTGARELAPGAHFGGVADRRHWSRAGCAGHAELVVRVGSPTSHLTVRQHGAGVIQPNRHLLGDSPDRSDVRRRSGPLQELACGSAGDPRALRHTASPLGP